MSKINASSFFAKGTQYIASQSLRFEDGDSAYLSWTPAGAGNRKTWTWSGWVKRGNLNSSGQLTLFDCNTASNDTSNLTIDFTNDSIRLQAWFTTFRKTKFNNR